MGIRANHNKPGYRGTPLNRFWAKVDFSGGCWIWNGAKHSNGYGPFYGFFQGTAAHRFAYECFGNSKIPIGFQIDHLCRNTLCVRPSHLEAVTQQENMARGKKGRLKNVA